MNVLRTKVKKYAAACLLFIVNMIGACIYFILRGSVQILTGTPGAIIDGVTWLLTLRIGSRRARRT